MGDAIRSITSAVMAALAAWFVTTVPVSPWGKPVIYAAIAIMALTAIGYIVRFEVKR